jgi:hypothetical protein
LGADTTILDCEDGVAANRKQEARENIREVLQDSTSDLSKISVRINSIQSNMALDDLKCIFQSQNKPKCIFVPKTDEIDQIKWLYENIHNLSNDCKFNLFFYMESSTSLLNLKDIISNAIDLSKVKYNSKFELEGTYFKYSFEQKIHYFKIFKGLYSDQMTIAQILEQLEPNLQLNYPLQDNILLPFAKHINYKYHI